VARRATAIAQERNRSGFVLLLDAGNSLVGDQDPARRTQGKSSVEAMNRLGYDAMALGPVDLTLGLTVLRQRMAEAKFTMLSANAVISATGELIAKPYIVRAYGDYRVAIVGLSAATTSKDISVRDPLTTAQAVVPEARRQAHAVILVSHAGPEVDRQIADSVPGITAIISAAPGPLAEPWRSDKTGTVVYRADEARSGHAGRNLGIARLTLDPQAKLAAQTWQRLALGPEVADDPAMAAWVQEQMNR
jgi:5'-nucleotidase